MTKYESATWKSSGGDARMTPVRPPKRNVTMNPTDHNISESNVTDPRHMEPIQLKNLIPVGTAIRKVSREKNGSSTLPVVNMWCAHTVNDRAPIDSVAKTMPL